MIVIVMVYYGIVNAELLATRIRNMAGIWTIRISTSEFKQMNTAALLTITGQ